MNSALDVVYIIAESLGAQQVFLERPATYQSRHTVRIPNVKIFNNDKDFFDVRGVGMSFESAANDFLDKVKGKILYKKRVQIVYRGLREEENNISGCYVLNEVPVIEKKVEQ